MQTGMKNFLLRSSSLLRSQLRYVLCVCFCVGGYVHSADAACNPVIRTEGNKRYLTVDGCSAQFSGTWNNGDGPTAHWNLKNGADITITAQARINNNQPDLVNARPFYVSGDGLNCTMELEEGFNADHMGYPDNWTNNGWSTSRFTNLTLISHHTRNLPTVHKKGGATGGHTHHGLLIFIDKPSVWYVRTNDQEYDGGLHWNTPVTLVTEKNLTYNGFWHEDGLVGIGSDGSTGATLTKEGPGALIIDGTPAHCPGSKIFVKEGSLVLKTDQGDPNNPYISKPYRASNVGQYLEVEVGAQGTVQCLAQRNGLKSLKSSGVVKIGTGTVDLTHDLHLSVPGKLLIDPSGSAPKVTVGGNARVGGAIELADVSLVEEATITLVKAGAISGSFDESALPPEAWLSYEGKEIKLHIKGVTSIDRLKPLRVLPAKSSIKIDGIRVFDPAGRIVESGRGSGIRIVRMQDTEQKVRPLLQLRSR